MNKQSKFHREQSLKDVDKNLPKWKHNILQWNEKHLGKLELFVERVLPFLVIILILIILADFGDYIANGFEKLYDLTKSYHSQVIIIDYIIISFFVIDLYFAFFKKATFWRFIKSHFIDIIAILPVGLLIRFYIGAATVIEGISAGQKITHAIADIPKVVEATADLEKLLKTERALKIEEVLAKGTRIEETAVKSVRGMRFFSRIPMFARILRARHIIHLLHLNKLKKKVKIEIKNLQKIKKK